MLNKIRRFFGVGLEWFDIASLTVFIVMSLLVFCAATVFMAGFVVKLFATVPILATVAVTLVALMFLRASCQLWVELYDNDLLSIRNLILAHLGVGVATVGEWFKKLFSEAK
jgi:hypothetical protein